jgi:acyl-homoserine-lactone acylase
MHTTSGVDAVDECAETIEHRGKELVYRHGAELRPVEQHAITLTDRSCGRATGNGSPQT